jgi:hypothetical protein
MMSFFSSGNSGDETTKGSISIERLDLEYIQRIAMILCCIVYLIKELIPEFKDSLSSMFTLLFRVILMAAMLYSVIINTPWKGVIEGFVQMWFNRMF